MNLNEETCYQKNNLFISCLVLGKFRQLGNDNNNLNADNTKRNSFVQKKKGNLAHKTPLFIWHIILRAPSPNCKTERL